VIYLGSLVILCETSALVCAHFSHVYSICSLWKNRLRASWRDRGVSKFLKVESKAVIKWNCMTYDISAIMCLGTCYMLFFFLYAVLFPICCSFSYMLFFFLYAVLFLYTVLFPICCSFSDMLFFFLYAVLFPICCSFSYMLFFFLYAVLFPICCPFSYMLFFFLYAVLFPICCSFSISNLKEKNAPTLKSIETERA